MTDLELLKLAAKAADIEMGEDRIDCGISLTGKDGRHRSLPQWNPLTDDGDALRLAVKLRLDVDCEHTIICVDKDINNMNADSSYHIGVRENRGSDPFAATRRAIVRAAAAIGERL